MTAHVLMVNKFLFPKGGAEGYMSELSRQLSSVGITSTCFGMRHPRNPELPASRFFPSEVDFEHPSGIKQRARAAGRMVWSREARAGMQALLRHERFDVAHLHNVYHQLSPSILPPLRAAGIPVVMTVHDYKLVCPVYTLTSHGETCFRCVGGHFQHVVKRRCNRSSLTASALVGFESWLHRARGAWDLVDVFITPSAFMRDRLIDGGYPPERIQVIRNAVDLDAAAPSFAAGDRMVYAGRLSHEKGLDVLVRAVAGTGVPLVMAGDGPQRQELERLADELAAPVAFLGHLDRSRLLEQVAGARAVVLPSVWPENCPLVVLEAMAMGKPVVATRVGGIPELVGHGEQGLLVEPGSVPQLEEALTGLWGDAALAERLGRSGRTRVEDEFSPADHLAKVVDVYRRLGVAIPDAVAA